MTTTVVIPAHNEAAVLGRTLEPLMASVQRGDLRIVIICNACTDNTEMIARSYASVDVLTTPVASKTHALNIGDDHAEGWPRVYLDADVVATEESILATARALEGGRLLAARPRARYDTTTSSPPVRSYYRARARVPSLHQSLWGAGVYALSGEGHERIGRFPSITGDDLWVDRAFASHEKAVIDTDAVIVRAPRSVRALRAITRRNVTGSLEAGPNGTSSGTAESTVRELAKSVRGPLSAWDALVYASVAGSARIGSGRSGGWERDDTSRR